MIGVGACPTKATGAAPSGNLTYLSTFTVKLRAPLIVSTLEYECGIGPRMIMNVIWITLEKLVQEHIEWKMFTISKKHVVPFQIWFIVHSVIHNTFSAQAL
jgi:hypothetical protein